MLHDHEVALRQVFPGPDAPVALEWIEIERWIRRDLRGDVDGDGQVSMAEYTTTWTETLAAEFLKYDANGDGIITPAECQAISGAPRR